MRRPLAPVQLNKPLPLPGYLNKHEPQAVSATRAHLASLATRSSPQTSPVLGVPQHRHQHQLQPHLLAPDSPIPTISIDGSLLMDGGQHAYAAYSEDLGAGMVYQHDASATRNRGQSPTRPIRARNQNQNRSQSPSLHQARPSSPAPSPTSRSAVSGSPAAPGLSLTVGSQARSGKATSAGTRKPIGTYAQTTTVDPRAHTRATTASLISLLDFLEAEEAEMRGEVQRVQRRMREVKRAVRAVKRARGLMAASAKGQGAGGRQKFADSEGEVTVGAAY